MMLPRPLLLGAVNLASLALLGLSRLPYALLIQPTHHKGVVGAALAQRLGQPFVPV
jgi:hypothetical protein